ncbi:hypothetical protein RB593_010298 [Gaeumannomyces tritici]
MTEPPLPAKLSPPDGSYRRGQPLHQHRVPSSPSGPLAHSGGVDTGSHAARGDFDPEFIAQVKTQSWSLFSVCMVFIVLRMYATLRRLPPTRWWPRTALRPPPRHQPPLVPTRPWDMAAAAIIPSRMVVSVGSCRRASELTTPCRPSPHRISRIKRLGIKNLQVDDYLVVLAGAFYTTLVVTLNLTCQNGGSNLYPPWTPQNFTDQQIKDRIFGFKLVLVSEQSMLNVIYTIRACMLVMYRRLTLGPTAQRLVKYLGWYVIAGYTSTQIAFFAGCRPFYNYRAMPAPDIQCNTLLIYNIIQACFNISSDCFLLCVVIPLILQVNVPWRKKAVLLFVFSVGGSVIIAATLTKIFGFSNIWDPNYMLWYMRESSVAIFVSNTPVIWPPLRELFPCLRSPAPGGGQRGPTPRNGLGGSAWAASPSPWRRKLGLCTTSVEYKTAAASDDMEMWLNGGICSGGASTAVRQQHTSTGSSASSGVECAIPARMASSEPPGPGPTGEQRPSGSAAAPTPAPTLAPGTGVNTAEVMALNGTPSSERRGGGGGAADERNLIFPPVTHNPPSDSSGAGGGGSAIIHVVSTVEVRAEERTRSSSIVVMERAGRTDVYDWERSGVSKHRVAAHGASTPT